MPAAHGAVAPTTAIRPRLSYYIPRNPRGTRRNGDVVAQNFRSRMSSTEKSSEISSSTLINRPVPLN
jgi:hypothetical protein